MFGRFKVVYVDEGPRRYNAGIIGASVDDGYDVVGQAIVELLRDIITTERVFKGQIEFVLPGQHLVALVTITALAGGARAENIDVYVFGQLFDVSLSATESEAVGYEPSLAICTAFIIGSEMYRN